MTEHSSQRSQRIHAMVVAGVSGAGKTTVGQALAAALAWRFLDADDYHSPANKAKMHAGQPLTDADRAPWLAALRAALADTIRRHEHAVLACSALKHAYRVALVPPDAPPGAVRFVQLDVPEPILEERLESRHHPFATPALLDSQLATLEEPAPGEALVVDGSRPVDEIVATIRRAFGL